MKKLWTAALLASGLVGLLMTLCGGGYTVMTLLTYARPVRGDDYRIAVFVVSVPSLLIGGAVLWLVRRRLRELRQRP